MGLIVVGFGLQDSITAIAKNQFVNLFTYQASAVFNGDATEEKKAQVQSEIDVYKRQHFTDHRLSHRVFSSVYGSDHCVQTAV